MGNLKRFRFVAVLIILSLVLEMPQEALARNYKGKYADLSSLFKKPKQSDMWLSLGISAAQCFLPAAFAPEGTRLAALSNASSNLAKGAFTSAISQMAMNVAIDKWNFNKDAAHVFGYGVTGLITGISTVNNDHLAFTFKKPSTLLGKYLNNHDWLRGSIGGVMRGSAAGGFTLLAYDAIKDTGFYENNRFLGNQLCSLAGNSAGYIGANYIMGDLMGMRVSIDVRIDEKKTGKDAAFKGRAYEDWRKEGAIDVEYGGNKYLRISNDIYGGGLFNSAKMAFSDPVLQSSFISQTIGMGIEYAAAKKWGIKGNDLHGISALGNMFGGMAGARLTGGNWVDAAKLGLCSGASSIALNQLGGKFDPKTGENKWGLTQLEMAGVNWLGTASLYAIAGSFGKEAKAANMGAWDIFKTKLNDFADNYTSWGGTAPAFTKGSTGWASMQYIQKIADFGGYANFKANADYAMKMGGYSSWKKFVNDGNLNNLFPSIENSLVRYATSSLQSGAVDNLSAVIGMGARGMSNIVKEKFKKKKEMKYFSSSEKSRILQSLKDGSGFSKGFGEDFGGEQENSTQKTKMDELKPGKSLFNLPEKGANPLESHRDGGMEEFTPKDAEKLLAGDGMTKDFVEPKENLSARLENAESIIENMPNGTLSEDDIAHMENALSKTFTERYWLTENKDYALDYSTEGNSYIVKKIENGQRSAEIISSVEAAEIIHTIDVALGNMGFLEKLETNCRMTENGDYIVSIQPIVQNSSSTESGIHQRSISISKEPAASPASAVTPASDTIYNFSQRSKTAYDQLEPEQVLNAIVKGKNTTIKDIQVISTEWENEQLKIEVLLPDKKTIVTQYIPEDHRMDNFELDSKDRTVREYLNNLNINQAGNQLSSATASPSAQPDSVSQAPKPASDGILAATSADTKKHIRVVDAKKDSELWWKITDIIRRQHPDGLYIETPQVLTIDTKTGAILEVLNPEDGSRTWKAINEESGETEYEIADGKNNITTLHDVLGSAGSNNAVTRIDNEVYQKIEDLFKSTAVARAVSISPASAVTPASDTIYNFSSKPNDAAMNLGVGEEWFFNVKGSDTPVLARILKNELIYPESSQRDVRLGYIDKEGNVIATESLTIEDENNSIILLPNMQGLSGIQAANAFKEYKTKGVESAQQKAMVSAPPPEEMKLIGLSNIPDSSGGGLTGGTARSITQPPAKTLLVNPLESLKVGNPVGVLSEMEGLGMPKSVKEEIGNKSMKVINIKEENGSKFIDFKDDNSNQQYVVKVGKEGKPNIFYMPFMSQGTEYKEGISRKEENTIYGSEWWKKSPLKNSSAGNNNIINGAPLSEKTNILNTKNTVIYAPEIVKEFTKNNETPVQDPNSVMAPGGIKINNNNLPDANSIALPQMFTADKIKRIIAGNMAIPEKDISRIMINNNTASNGKIIDI